MGADDQKKKSNLEGFLERKKKDSIAEQYSERYGGKSLDQKALDELYQQYVEKERGIKAEYQKYRKENPSQSKPFSSETRDRLLSGGKIDPASERRKAPPSHLTVNQFLNLPDILGRLVQLDINGQISDQPPSPSQSDHEVPLVEGKGQILPMPGGFDGGIWIEDIDEDEIDNTVDIFFDAEEELLTTEETELVDEALKYLPGQYPSELKETLPHQSDREQAKLVEERNRQKILDEVQRNIPHQPPLSDSEVDNLLERYDQVNGRQPMTMGWFVRQERDDGRLGNQTSTSTVASDSVVEAREDLSTVYAEYVAEQIDNGNDDWVDYEEFTQTIYPQSQAKAKEKIASEKISEGMDVASKLKASYVQETERLGLTLDDRQFDRLCQEFDDTIASLKNKNKSDAAEQLRNSPEEFAKKFVQRPGQQIFNLIRKSGQYNVGFILKGKGDNAIQSFVVKKPNDVGGAAPDEYRGPDIGASTVRRVKLLVHSYEDAIPSESMLREAAMVEWALTRQLDVKSREEWKATLNEWDEVRKKTRLPEGNLDVSQKGPESESKILTMDDIGQALLSVWEESERRPVKQQSEAEKDAQTVARERSIEQRISSLYRAEVEKLGLEPVEFQRRALCEEFKEVVAQMVEKKLPNPMFTSNPESFVEKYMSRPSQLVLNTIGSSGLYKFGIGKMPESNDLVFAVKEITSPAGQQESLEVEAAKWVLGPKVPSGDRDRYQHADAAIMEWAKEHPEIVVKASYALEKQQAKKMEDNLRSLYEDDVDRRNLVFCEKQFNYLHEEFKETLRELSNTNPKQAEALSKNPGEFVMEYMARPGSQVMNKILASEKYDQVFMRDRKEPPTTYQYALIDASDGAEKDRIIGQKAGPEDAKAIYPYRHYVLEKHKIRDAAIANFARDPKNQDLMEAVEKAFELKRDAESQSHAPEHAKVEQTVSAKGIRNPSTTGDMTQEMLPEAECYGVYKAECERSEVAPLDEEKFRQIILPLFKNDKQKSPEITESSYFRKVVDIQATKKKFDAAFEAEKKNANVNPGDKTKIWRAFSKQAFGKGDTSALRESPGTFIAAELKRGVDKQSNGAVAQLDSKTTEVSKGSTKIR